MRCYAIILGSFAVLACSGRAIDVGPGGSAGAAGNTGMDAGSDAASNGVSQMTVQVGSTQYDYSCAGTDFGSGANGEGPGLDAISMGVCDWPTTNPRLDLQVLFSGFLPSVGFPVGTYDLAAPTPQTVVVALEVASQAEVPVGQGMPYQVYSSAPVTPNANAPARSAAGTSGTVTVGAFKPIVAGGYAVDVTLTNVVLPSLGDADGYDTSNYPSTVTIESAHLVSAPPYSGT